MAAATPQSLQIGSKAQICLKNGRVEFERRQWEDAAGAAMQSVQENRQRSAAPTRSPHFLLEHCHGNQHQRLARGKPRRRKELP